MPEDNEQEGKKVEGEAHGIARGLIYRFSREFKHKLKGTVKVTYTLDADIASVREYFTLGDIEFVCNNILREVDSDASIRDKSRESHIKTCRQMYFIVARDARYKWCDIGDFIDFDHSTAVHSAKAIKSLLDVRDLRITDLYRRVRIGLKQLGYSRTPAAYSKYEEDEAIYTSLPTLRREALISIESRKMTRTKRTRKNS